MTDQRDLGQTTDGPIQFKPAHSGVGFHPFSNGLPYTPTPGAGTFAGRPPKTVVPRVNKVPSPQKNETEALKTNPIELHLDWSYLLLRLIAYGLDIISMASLTVSGFGISLLTLKMSPWILLDSSLILMSIAMTAFFCWALILIQELIFQTSLGKIIVGLRLRGSATSIFLRSLLFIPSFIFGGFGLFWGLFDSEKRCWHDVATDLQPSRITRL